MIIIDNSYFGAQGEIGDYSNDMRPADHSVIEQRIVPSTKQDSLSLSADKRSLKRFCPRWFRDSNWVI